MFYTGAGALACSLGKFTFSESQLTSALVVAAEAEALVTG